MVWTSLPPGFSEALVRRHQLFGKVIVFALLPPYVEADPKGYLPIGVPEKIK